MPSMLQLLVMLLMPIAFAAMVKLAALAYRRTALLWRHAVVYALLVLATGTVLGLAHKVLSSPLGLLLLLAISLVAQASIGGWFLGPRALNAQGQPLGFRGGAILATFAFALTMAVLLLPPFLYFGLQFALQGRSGL